MIEIFRISHLAAFLVATVALSLTTRASALEPEQADLVTSVSLQLPSSFDIEEETAYIGITGCESMVRNQGKITTTWETVFDPTTADGGELVRDFWFFSVDRGAGARIACGESGDLCTAVDDEDVDFTSSTLTVELDFTELAELEDPEECTGFDSEFFVRATVREDVDLDTNQNADARYIVDTVRPSAPSGLTAMVTEDTIDVEFEGSADQDVSRYFVFWSTSPFEGGANPDELELNRKVLGEDPSGSVSVDLTTDAVYVAVAAQDETGNFSMLSGVVESNVVETRDFWEEYKAAGGTEDGGCSTV